MMRCRPEGTKIDRGGYWYSQVDITSCAMQIVNNCILLLLSSFRFHIKVIVLPAQSDSNVMFCLQSYQGLTCRIDRSQ